MNSANLFVSWLASQETQKDLPKNESENAKINESVKEEPKEQTIEEIDYNKSKMEIENNLEKYSIEQSPKQENDIDIIKLFDNKAFEDLANEDVVDGIAKLIPLLIHKGFSTEDVPSFRREIRRRILEKYPEMSRYLIAEAMTKCMENLQTTEQKPKDEPSIDDILNSMPDSPVETPVRSPKITQKQIASPNTLPLIYYDTKINSNGELKAISWEDIDKYEFKFGFNEFFGYNNEKLKRKSEDVHLYFDFDEIKSEEELKSVLEWLDQLRETFGNYSIGGYTNNEDIRDNFGLKLVPDGGHFVSMHVVFYETRISSKELIDIMKHTVGKGFITEGVHPLCDYNVYKLDSRQCFRHVLSNKIISGSSKKNAGCILNGLPPSSQIVQTKGTEPLITKAQWSKHFKISEKQELKRSIKDIRKTTQQIIHNEAADFLGATGPIVCEPSKPLKIYLERPT